MRSAPLESGIMLGKSDARMELDRVWHEYPISFGKSRPESGIMPGQADARYPDDN